MESIALEYRIKAFASLGRLIRQILTKPSYDSIFPEVLAQAGDQNPWFTPESLRKSLELIAAQLDKEKLQQWLSPYNLPSLNPEPLIIGTIMAGNIPMVGFHDLLCILITGNSVSARLSSKDSIMLKYLTAKLIEIEPRFKAMIDLRESLPPYIQAIIATGSDNSSRYFEYNYGKLPHIFRKNRNSIAIIRDGISAQELKKLGNDIFDYFGLGCRSVSMIFIPRQFRLDQLTGAWKDFSYVLEVEPYRVNYNYHRALYRTAGENFYDAGNIILKESGSYNSPVSVLHYRYYDNHQSLVEEIKLNTEKIQLVIGEGFHKFGTSQSPGLREYADNIDTIDFLLSLKGS